MFPTTTKLCKDRATVDDSSDLSNVSLYVAIMIENNGGSLNLVLNSINLKLISESHRDVWELFYFGFFSSTTANLALWLIVDWPLNSLWLSAQFHSISLCLTTIEGKWSLGEPLPTSYFKEYVSNDAHDM